MGQEDSARALRTVKNGGIYLSPRPREIRADLMLTYDRESETVLCAVPRASARFAALRDAVEAEARRQGRPGAFEVVDFQDRLGRPRAVFYMGQLRQGGCSRGGSVATIYADLIPAVAAESDRMAAGAALVRALEPVFQEVRLLRMEPRSGVIRMTLGVDDGSGPPSGVLGPYVVWPGNNAKFLCDCGQFPDRAKFKSKCWFAVGAGDGGAGVGRGFFYNDASRGYADYVSLGNGRFFRSLSYVDKAQPGAGEGGACSWRATARNIDEKRVEWAGPDPSLPANVSDGFAGGSSSNAFGSVEEAELTLAAQGRLRPGVACYLARRMKGPNGSVRAQSVDACWDGSRWVDYDTEAELKGWPDPWPGWTPE